MLVRPANLSRMSTRSWLPWCVAACGGVVTSFATWLSLAQPAPSATRVSAPEYSVKAGYLLLFARYVQWPEHAFKSSDAPLVIAVVGHDPFGSVLDETLRDQHVGTHGVRVVRTNDPTADMQAHIVFVAARQQPDEQRWLQMFRDRATLTVGESADSLDAGAIIRLAEERGKIRFDIDWASATRVNLKIASPMLVSARQVRGAPADFREGAKP
jgi:hypothetical protein